MKSSTLIGGGVGLAAVLLIAGCTADVNPDFAGFSPHPFGAEGHKAYLKSRNYTLDECYACHTPPGNIAVDNEITGAPSCAECHNPSLSEPLGCNACHGNPAANADEPLDWAPPTDLSGNDSRSSPGVGAHQAHLNSSTGLFAKVECGVCHAVPTTWNRRAHFNDIACVTCHKPTPRWDQGHMVDESPGRAEVAMTFPATKRGRTPEYNTATGTCSSVWCHGTNEPVWTSTESFTDCAACHGYNPVRDTYGTHPRTTSITECAACHRQVVDAAGNIIRPDFHADGNIQF